mgnify:CR=1 FL=1
MTGEELPRARVRRKRSWLLHAFCIVPLLARITIQPDICHGKLVFRGLRYPVESVQEYLAAGDSFKDVLKESLDLEREDLLACLEFAAC